MPPFSCFPCLPGGFSVRDRAELSPSQDGEGVAGRPPATELTRPGARGQSSSGETDRRRSLVWLRRRLDSRRRRLEARVGLVAIRRRGRTDAWRIRSTSRSSASCRLRAVSAGVDHQHAVAGHPPAGQRGQALADLVGQRGRVGRVEPELDGRGNLVDVLPARARGADELHLDLALVQHNVRRDANHAASIARPSADLNFSIRPAPAGRPRRRAGLDVRPRGNYIGGCPAGPAPDRWRTTHPG
jgi:hypothetical protein